MAIDPASVPVVILCGGKGMRLREETEFRPKPLVSIGSRPLLWHIMKHYAQAGFKRFVLCLGHKGNQIREYFLRYRLYDRSFTIKLGAGPSDVEVLGEDPEDWTVTLAETGEDSMTGARVQRALSFFDDPVFALTYGDGVSDVDLGALLAFHEDHGKLATVTGVRPRSRFGELRVEGDRVVKFSEKPAAHDGRINGGFFLMNRGIGDYLSADPGCVLEQEPLEKLSGDDQLMVYEHDGFWQCMDTYRDLTLLQGLWSSGQAAWKTW